MRAGSDSRPAVRAVRDFARRSRQSKVRRCRRGCSTSSSTRKTGWDEAKVTGTLSLRQAGSTEWKADFQGELLDVDLGPLVGRRFPRHRLTGRARVAFEKARWGERPGGQGPGWVEVKGELMAGQGSIGVDLLEALAREMKFRPSARRSHVSTRGRPRSTSARSGCRSPCNPTARSRSPGRWEPSFRPTPCWRARALQLLRTARDRQRPWPDQDAVPRLGATIRAC